jgi:hypothetical protein
MNTPDWIQSIQLQHTQATTTGAQTIAPPVTSPQPQTPVVGLPVAPQTPAAGAIPMQLIAPQTQVQPHFAGSVNPPEQHLPPQPLMQEAPLPPVVPVTGGEEAPKSKRKKQAKEETAVTNITHVEPMRFQVSEEDKERMKHEDRLNALNALLRGFAQNPGVAPANVAELAMSQMAILVSKGVL